MNFDLSALDNLQKKGAAAKSTKFVPTSRSRLRNPAPKEEKIHAERNQPAQQEEKRRQDAAKGKAAKLGAAVSSQAQTADAAPAVAQGAKAQTARPEPARLLQSSAQPNKQRDGPPAELPTPGRKQDQQRRYAKVEAHENSAQAEAGAGSSGFQLALVPAHAEPSPAHKEPLQRGARGKAKEAPVIDPSTMSLKAIIKCAYAQERVRLEEERRRKKEEEDAIRAEGSEPQRAPVKPKLAQARAAPMRAMPSMVPQLAMVNGKPVIMESSLHVQAQAEDLQRVITVEDNPKLNNASYSNRINNDRWTPQETELFFKAMKLFGTDFSLMEKMFPGRQRKALKFKLRREYKDNPERIDAALSGKGCDASSYQEVVKALHKHTEAQDGNLILGGPQEDPDLADVLRGPAADDQQNTDGAEAPDEPAPAPGSMQLASVPESSGQAAQPGPARVRRGRASVRAPPPEQPANSAQAEQTAAKPRGSGRRKRGAPMASIAEEAAAPEQPSDAPSEEGGGAAKGTWGGRRRRKAPAIPQSAADGLDHSSAAAQGQAEHAGTQPQTAAPAADRHAEQPVAEHDQASDQGAASKALTAPKEAVSNGTGASGAETQDKQDMPRPAAGRRKRQTPVSAALPDSSGAPGPAKRAKAPARAAQRRPPMSMVEVLAEAAGACAAELEEKGY